MIQANWSIRDIQDIILDDNQWEKKNMYATDSERCLCGVYHSLKGDKPTSPTTARQKRKMEVGTMIEVAQIKKLKALGIYLGGQERIHDEEYAVSGRPDALIISPTNCSEEVKLLISRKKSIADRLRVLEKEYWEAVEEEDLMKRNNVQNLKDVLYSRDRELSSEILRLAEADPTNQIMLLEIKSIVTTGFEWRLKEGKPMDSHVKQVHLYIWKLKNRFKNLITRIVYVDNAYQDIAEFDVVYDERIIEDLKKKWKAIKDAVDTDTPPPPCSDIVQNPMTGRWQVNYQAEWCNYHALCTGDPGWKEKAIKRVEELNSQLPKRTYARRKKPAEKDNNTNEPKLQGDKA